jgi:hypothetical protein
MKNLLKISCLIFILVLFFLLLNKGSVRVNAETTADDIYIYPTSGRWNYTPSFIVRNDGDTTITNMSYLLDCWDPYQTQGTCADKTGYVTLKPGESATLGLGLGCYKWQLDFGEPKNQGYIVEVDDSQCGNGTTSTPNPTATGLNTATPVPTAYTKSCSPNCSSEQIGNFTFDIFSPVTEDLVINTDYWIKITIRGRSDSTNKGTSINVQKVINDAYFQIYPLAPTTTIKLFKNSVDITTAACGASLSDCISTMTNKNFDLKLPVAMPQDTYTLYFKVKTIAQSNNETIPVEDIASHSTYSDTYSESLDNINVRIKGNLPYYISENSGDVYSQGGINDHLPDAGAYMLTGELPGILASNSNNIYTGPGRISKKRWTIITPINNNAYSYDNLTATIKNFTVLDNTDKIKESGIYKVTSDYTIKANTLPNLKNKQIVILIDGNLYLQSGVEIPEDGKSSLMIMAQKNIGIASNIKDVPGNKINGIYFTDGKIDTACDTQFIANDCAPTSQIAEKSTLNLEGMFYAGSGYNLDRTGDPDNQIAGEKFIYRPDMLIATSSIFGKILYSWSEITP